MSVNGKYVRYWHIAQDPSAHTTCHCHIVNSRKVIVRISECRETVRERAREMVSWGYLMVALHFRSFWNDSEKRGPEKKCAFILLGHFPYGAQHKRLAGGLFDDWKRMRAIVGRGRRWSVLNWICCPGNCDDDSHRRLQLWYRRIWILRLQGTDNNNRSQM